MEPDLEHDLAVDADELRFVVLSGRLVVPDLDAAPMGGRVQCPADVDDDALVHVLHLMEERPLHRDLGAGAGRVGEHCEGEVCVGSHQLGVER